MPDSPTSGFKVGDRVTSDAHPHLSEEFHNQTGTILAIGNGTASARWVRVKLDNVDSPFKQDGWDFSPERLSIIETEPTEEEIAKLFGITPSMTVVDFLISLRDNPQVPLNIQADISQYLVEDMGVER